MARLVQSFAAVVGIGDVYDLDLSAVRDSDFCRVVLVGGSNSSVECSIIDLAATPPDTGMSTQGGVIFANQAQTVVFDVVGCPKSVSLKGTRINVDPNIAGTQGTFIFQAYKNG